MATTSKALAQGTAPAGHGGRHLGQWLVALAAAAALGLALLVGGLATQGRRAADTPAAAPASQANPYWVYQEDAVIDGNPAAVAYPFVPDQFTYREDRRVEIVPGVAPVTPLPIAPTGPADEYTNEQPH